MATHGSDKTIAVGDVTEFRGGGKLIALGGLLGIAGIGAALALGMKGAATFRPFLFGYLAAYAFVLALSLGCLAFVLLQHLTRAAWSVGVRRTAENFAGALPVLAVFALPILISVASLNGSLYRWAIPMSRASADVKERAEAGEYEDVEDPATYAEAPTPSASAVATNVHQEVQDAYHKFAAPSDPADFKLDALDLAKRTQGLRWLNPWFFIVRIIFYLAVWSFIAIWFRRLSLQQDRTGDPNLTLVMQGRAAPAIVLLALTITGAAFDLLMSLDPHWYSTMFGIYYITNCFVGSFALLIITVFLLQRFGYIRRTISPEHYHDLGKFLFAFTFFYGYIAFSQYMLLWYSNIPEEIPWFTRHGASTLYQNGWNVVILAILFGHILIPFAGLLSRHIKRAPWVLIFWAIWQFVFVAVDMYWIVMPEIGETAPNPATILVTACAVVGLLGVLFAVYGALARGAALRPLRDPRLDESLAFHNI